eukprot:gene15246-4560_t
MARFDTVTSMNVLCEETDPIRVLENYQWICKPNGRIMMMELGKNIHVKGSKLYRFQRWYYDSILRF